MIEEQDQTQNEPHKDTSPSAPVDASPESALPTPAHEEVERVHDQVTQDDDPGVVEGDEEPPSSSDDDPGDDPDVPNEAAPSEHSTDSVEADQEDDKGAEV